MSSAAANADLPPVLPRPSIFISYASENRAAARLLRDALETAGLDVWYDENELGGGDAWDQKIRRQIRECTYFMPVISAQTEARREGYFRREWRLAVDRSHDMADDVMFLLPVVIDGTGEGGARVPEKFLTVQWLKVPGGVATPALTTLASRLAHGEHLAPAPAAPRPTFVPPTVKGGPVRPVTFGSSGSAQAHDHPHAHHDGPPPMPHFPVRPTDKGDTIKYLAEVIWWIISTVWMLFKRLPKWARVCVAIWFVFSFMARCSRDDETPAAPRPTKAARAKAAETKATAAKSDPAESLKEAATHLDAAAKDPANGALGAGIARVGADLARSISKEIAIAAQADDLLAVVPFAFTATDPGDSKFASDVFGLVFGRLTLVQPGRVVVHPVTDPSADDATLRRLAQNADASRLLLARIVTTEGKAELAVQLFAVGSATEVWSAHFPIAAGDPAAAADAITRSVLAVHPPKPPAAPAKP